ncbi:hypothetical protein PMIN06_013157 [Paraphaeosphaeria minitans]
MLFSWNSPLLSLFFESGELNERTLSLLYRVLHYLQSHHKGALTIPGALNLCAADGFSRELDQAASIETLVNMDATGLSIIILMNAGSILGLSGKHNEKTVPPKKACRERWMPSKHFGRGIKSSSKLFRRSSTLKHNILSDSMTTKSPPFKDWSITARSSTSVVDIVILDLLKRCVAFGASITH